MTGPETAAIIVAGLSFLTTICGIVYFGAFRVSKIESRVELLWAFLLRRGVTDALLGGIMEKASPLKLKVETLQKHQALLDRAQAFYDAEGRKLNDISLIEEIERRFGIELGGIATSYSMNAGGCLIALVFLLRPNMPLFKQFDTQDWGTIPGRPGAHGGLAERSGSADGTEAGKESE